MNVGESNKNGQKLIEKTANKSTTHSFAKIWVLQCSKCGAEYGSNSCDAHIRKCPNCDKTAAKPEPIE
ncbi:MAG: hypothetical protein A2Y23_05115 [Clostridiales bacterium GWB2_37_7]|nr:MAG: hypothetical protein A2Y23_05115 [Clostridiales bacterium GWB2_37_7]